MVVITPARGALTAASSIEHTFMITLDHVGDQEAMVYAQLGQQPLARTTEASLQPRQRRDALLFERAASCSRFLDRDQCSRFTGIIPGF